MSGGPEQSTLTASEHVHDDRVANIPLTNRLRLELSPFRLERIHDYTLKGFHPVHLGDTYGENERYRVVHKLGHGGFATIWLCRDTTAESPQYVALKVLKAGASGDNCRELQMSRTRSSFPDDIFKFICLPLDIFNIQGPNGHHLAFVYPLLGPHVSAGVFHASPDLDHDLRSFALQVVKSVKLLHGRGICHGDITPKNILHQVCGLDGLTEMEVLQKLGTPVTNPVLGAPGPLHNQPNAPQYLVYPIDWYDVDVSLIQREVCLIDFGESFRVTSDESLGLSPNIPKNLGIPGSYRSPELILEKKAGIGSDLWALGCTLFEIRTGRKLFEPFDDEDDNYLDDFVLVFGVLPEPWWSTTWKNRRNLYKDEPDEQGRAVFSAATEPQVNSEALGSDEHTNEQASAQEQKDSQSTIHPSVVEEARSLIEKLAPGLWYMPDHRPEEHHREISMEEMEVFADLLHLFFKYKPEERISAEDAMAHPWFSYSSAGE